MRILLLGATGTIGRATLAALLARGHEVITFGRTAPPAAAGAPASPRLVVRTGDVRDPAAYPRDALAGGERIDALVSCLASRTGVAAEAWAIDHLAHRHALAAAKAAGARHVVLLSAICVQKPVLAFQHAKLAFERELMASGLAWSIVRPTAYFKSVSGQVGRVKAGRPYLLFGDGALTACKPIADEDLADYLAGCLDGPDAPARTDRILPIGGPGPALTPREMGTMLFELLGREPRFRAVPVGLIDTIAGGLGLAARLVPALETKAELARIGRYYATESMLVWDAARGRYDAGATPEHGTRTLRDHFAALLGGTTADDRGAHAVF